MDIHGYMKSILVWAPGVPWLAAGVQSSHSQLSRKHHDQNYTTSCMVSGAAKAALEDNNTNIFALRSLDSTDEMFSTVVC